MADVVQTSDNICFVYVKYYLLKQDFREKNVTSIRKFLKHYVSSYFKGIVIY